MVPSTGSLVVLIALALTAHAHSFFHQHCVDYDSLDESNSREVSLNVISDDCGVPVVDAVFNQYCFKHFAIVPEVVPTQQVVPGIYKFRAPHYQHHFITAEKAGYHATMASIEYGNSKVTKTLKMLCNSPPMWDMFHTGYTASQCTTNTAQLTVNYVCEATGSPAPEIYPRGSVTMETVSSGVVTFDTCPSCSGTVVIIVDGVTHEYPVPTEDQVLDLACPVDGGWTNFGVWGECSVTCGTGVQTHTRTCTDPAPLNDGADCQGEQTEEQECTMPDCIVPINGGWSFSAWTECSTTCNEGKQQRSRTCNNPEPDNGGADCEGDPTESRTCNLGKSCPVIVAVDNEEIELSTYDRSVGTYVLIGCRRFARHISQPTSVLCLESGAWSEQPVLECNYALNTEEALLVGVGVACGALFILCLTFIVCYYCVHQDPHKRKRMDMDTIYRERAFFNDPFPRGPYGAPRSAKYSSRRYSDPWLDDNFQNILFEEEPRYVRTPARPSIEVIELDDPEPVYNYLDAPSIIHDDVDNYTSLPVIPYRNSILLDAPRYATSSTDTAPRYISSDPRYNEQAPSVASRNSFSELDPNTIYIGYHDTYPQRLNHVTNGHISIPRARIKEVDDATSSSSINVNRALVPLYGSRSRFAQHRDEQGSRESERRPGSGMDKNSSLYSSYLGKSGR